MSNHRYVLARAPVSIDDVDLRLGSKVLGSSLGFNSAFAIRTRLDNAGGDQPDRLDGRCFVGVSQRKTQFV